MSETPQVPEDEVIKNVNPLLEVDNALKNAANNLVIASETETLPKGYKKLLERSRQTLREKEQEFRKRALNAIRINKSFSLRRTGQITTEQLHAIDHATLDTYPDSEEIIDASIKRAGGVTYLLPIAEGPYQVLKTVLHELGVDIEFTLDEWENSIDPLFLPDGRPTKIPGINVIVTPPSVQLGEKPASHTQDSPITGRPSINPEVLVNIDDKALRRIYFNESLPPLELPDEAPK